MHNNFSKYVLPLLVAIFAAGYFLLSYNRTFNPVDEGYLLNNFLKTANGQIPHRDFYDDYGPATYWLGGAIFHLFGTKILAVRIFLVVLKTAMATLVFLIGRKILSNAFAFLAAVFFILAWGDPLFPAINILYAGHMSHFLSLLAILFMIQYVETENRRWLAATAVCIGCSLSFKLPAGIIDFIGFSVFLSMRELVQYHSVGELEKGAPKKASYLRLLREGKCLGILSVIIFYLLLFHDSHLDFYYFFLFLFPFFFFLGYLFKFEVGRFKKDASDPHSRERLTRCYGEIFLLAAGPLLFFLAESAYYLLVGGMEEFIYDSFILPLNISFYTPMVDYRLHAVLSALIAALVLCAAYLAKSFRNKTEYVREKFWNISFLLLLLVPIALIVKKTSFETLHLRITHLLPPVTLLLTLYFLITGPLRLKEGESNRANPLPALLFIFGCQSFLISFPRTDEVHIQLNSTVLYILVCLLLQRMHDEWRLMLPSSKRVRGIAFLAAGAIMLAAPYIWSMKLFSVFSPRVPDSALERIPDSVKSQWKSGRLNTYPELVLDFPQSSGLRMPLWPRPPLNDFVTADIPKTVQFIVDNTGDDDTIAVFCEAQIIYLLSGRESFLQKEDYFIFLATTGLINESSAVRLTDEQIIEKLREKRPRFIIQSNVLLTDHSTRIISTWPRAYSFIRDNYQIVRSIGFYDILAPRA